MGVRYSTIGPGTNKSVYDWLPPEQLVTGIGIKQTGVIIGGAISAALLSAIAEWTSWRTSLGTVGLIGVCSLLLLRSYSRPDEASASESASVSFVEQFQTQLRGTVAAVRETKLPLLVFSGVFFGTSQFTIMAYAVLYLIEQLGLTPTVAGLVYMLMQLFGVGSRVGFGYVADGRFATRKPTLLVGIGALGCLAYLPVILLDDESALPVVIVAFAVLGAFTLGYNGIYLTISNELAGAEYAGASTSVAIAGVMLGAVVTPPAFGHLAEATGTYAIPLAMLAVASLLAGLTAIWTRTDANGVRR